MTIKDTITMILLYSGCKNMTEKSVLAATTFKPDLDAAVPKSIRFIKTEKEVKKIQSSVIRAEKDLANTGIDAYEYSIRKEDACRLALVSDKYEKEFAVRLFTDEKTYSKFKSNAKISSVAEINYKTAKIMEYRAGESSVIRYAVLAPKDIPFDVEEFMGTKNNFTAVNSTAFFAE